MNSQLFLGAYWDARRETLEESIDRALIFFRGLAEIDPRLAQWRKLGRSRQAALASTVDVLDPAVLRTLLLKGRGRRDVGGEIIEKLGFELALWNGAANDDESASVSIRCGSFSAFTGNSVVMDLPVHSQNVGEAHGAAALLVLVAQTWRPKWAGIMSRHAMDQRGFNADHPFVDWMVYVPRSVEQCPEFSKSISLPGVGTVVITQPTPPLGSDLAELQRIRTIEAILAA